MARLRRGQTTQHGRGQPGADVPHLRGSPGMRLRGCGHGHVHGRQDQHRHDRYDPEQAARQEPGRGGDELRKVTGGKVFGLFDMGGLSLELDRDPEEPSCAEMVAAVLRVMKSSPGKFIAMLESENTDAAAHDNDLPSTLAALDEFERGVRLTYAQRSLSHTASADRVYPTAAHLAMARVARTSVNAASARRGDRGRSGALPGLHGQHEVRAHTVRPDGGPLAKGLGQRCRVPTASSPPPSLSCR